MIQVGNIVGIEGTRENPFWQVGVVSKVGETTCDVVIGNELVVVALRRTKRYAECLNYYVETSIIADKIVQEILKEEKQ